MKNLFNYFKETFGKIFFLFITTVGVFWFGGLQDANEGDLVPFFVILGLTIIYIGLFAWDYNKWKNSK
jgi:uncharacterized protein (DUF983 family)